LPTNRLRTIFLKLGGINIGQDIKVRKNARIWHGVKIGNNVEIRDGTFLEFVEIGDYSVIDYGSILTGVPNKNYKIGKNCYIGYYSILDGSGGLEIGDYVHIAGPSVGIWTHTSVFQVLQRSEIFDHTHRKEAPVKIENNVWIGGKVTIYPGVNIGNYSIILPNSVVDKNVPSFTMVGGVPFKIIRRIEVDGDGNIIFRRP
jgi:acetyltransferase-like isoleucine patch superfamily enzyme